MLSRSSSPSSSTTDALEPLSPRPQVGGLPLHELNQLELQFLLLNDFRLKIPTDELQRYADQLILYWVGRNGTSNPAAAAAGRSRAASRARTPPRDEAVDGAASAHGEPSEAVETPPLTRSAVAAAAAQAQHRAADGSGSGSGSGASAAQQQQQYGAAHASSSASTSSPYPAHLAHSSSTSGARTPSAFGSDAHGPSFGTPTQRGLASSSSSSLPRRAAGPPPYGAPHAQAQAQSPHRPRSIRSHPSTSSSFSSSTVTPGTPSTTRADDDDEEEEDDGWGDEDEDDGEDGGFEGKERGRDGRATARDGSRSRSRARGRTGSWGVAAGEPMQED